MFDFHSIHYQFQYIAVTLILCAGAILHEITGVEA